MEKNKAIVSTGLVLGAFATLIPNQQSASSVRQTIESTAAPTMKVINLKEEEPKDKIVVQHKGEFMTLTRVTAEPTAKPKKLTASKKETVNSSKKTIHNNTTNRQNTQKLYNSIPLSASFQKWIDKKCNEYGISTSVVMGVISTESKFNVSAIGDRGEAFGLMQVQKKWHRKRMSKLGITDLMNCYNNVHVGIDFLAELYRANNKNWHKTLMAYNGGQSYANKRCRNGLYSSEYSRKVMSKAEKYKAERK